MKLNNVSYQYKRFRWFFTSSGKLVIGGKNAEQNEQVIKQTKPKEIVLHTKAAGSPFCNIKGKADKKDIKEAAVFCAKYSREWKKAKEKKSVEIHYFKKKDIFKKEDMKTGTFGVKKFKAIKVNKEDIEKIE